MARKTIRETSCDVCGTSPAPHYHRFMWNGQNRATDLCTPHHEQLTAAMEPFLAASYPWSFELQPTRRRRTTSSTRG